MKLLEKLNEWIGFTPSERKVVLFLVITFLLGWGIKLYKNVVSSPQKYDYTAADSEFAARSRLLVSGVSGSGAKDSSAVLGRPAARKRTPGKMVNINTATKEELIGLPGVGEATAEGIILYRDENGPFSSVEELQNVKGIGKKKLARLAPFCTIQQ